MKIKFVGKFKDLIPIGFSFHKLYARNYKVYTKNSVWIWVSRRVVEIKDLNEVNSYKVASLIINKKYPVYEKDTDYKIISFKKGEPKCTILDNKTGDIIIYNDFMKLRNYNHDYDRNRYRELILNISIFETINYLFTNGMISL